MRRYRSLLLVLLVLLVLVWLGVATAWAQEPGPSKKPGPSISLQPSSLNFGEVLLGESAQRAVTVVNEGKAEAELEELQLNGNRDFALLEDRCSGRTLKTGQQCGVLIAFTPGGSGERLAELQVIDDDDELLGRLPISGQGIAPMPVQPVMVVASPLDFGQLTVGLQAEQALSIRNEGGASLVIGQIGLAVPLTAPFSLTSDLCSGRTLAPGGNCSLRLTFAPTAAGSYGQEFDIPSNDPQRNPALVRLQGAAVEPPPVPVPKIRIRDSSPPDSDRHLDFGEVPVGSRVEQTVTVRNEGEAALEIGALRDHPLAPPFTVNRDDCSGKRLNLGKECTIRILYNPLTAGDFAENLLIPSNDPAGLVTVSLVGRATELPEARLEVTDSLPPIDDLRLPFGTVSIGHTVEQKVTLRNSGNAPLRLGPIAAAQLLRQPFAIASDPCSNRTLQPQAVCTLPIIFAPTAAGTFEGTFDIPAEVGATITFRVTGTGTEAALPRISVTDSLPPVDDQRLDFTEVTVDRTVEATVTVSNSGTADLRIAQLPALKAPFRLSADQCSQTTLRVGESCLLLVQFTPAATVAYAAELAIPSNDPAQPQVRLALAGRGLAAGINQPPSPPRLLSPGAGQQDLGLLVTLRWQLSSDPDGDSLQYRVLWSTDSSLANAEEGLLATSSKPMLRAEFLLLVGLCGVGALRRSGKAALLLLLASLLLSLSCSSGSEERADVGSWQLRELQSATTYYWQVIVEDGRGGMTGSEIRAFSTGRR